MMSTNKYKYLGVLVDQTANLNEHFCSVFKKASDRLRLLKKIRHCLAMDAAQSVYKCMIVPLLTYSSIVTFNLNATQTARVQNLQDRATRTIKSGESAHLKVPDLMNLAKFQTCLLVKQCMDMNTCSNFSTDYFERLQHEKNTRNNGFSLKISKIRLESTKSAFYYNGAIQFNKLPFDVRATDSFMQFKRALKEHFNL